jgi:hypothetical protein
MREGETELEIVRRHVEDGVQCIARQRALIAQLRRDHLPVDEAEALLATFQDIQRLHEEHLARISGDA